jgi:excisionase family DNA binding protein
MLGENAEFVSALNDNDEGKSMNNGSISKKWSVEQAAEALGVSPHTIRAWLRQRRVPYLKLGRRVLLDPQDVQRFIDSNRVESVSFDGKGL